MKQMNIQIFGNPVRPCMGRDWEYWIMGPKSPGPSPVGPMGVPIIFVAGSGTGAGK